jgi:hypothetical protein
MAGPPATARSLDATREQYLHEARREIAIFARRLHLPEQWQAAQLRRLSEATQYAERMRAVLLSRHGS